MGGLKKIAIFFLVWLFAVQAVAAEPSVPRLSVVQRNNESRLLFSWDRPVDFAEKIESGRYTLTFLLPSAEPVGRLKQILTAFPASWKQMQLKQVNGQLVFSVVLPKKAHAFATKEKNEVFVSLSENKPADVRPSRISAPVVNLPEPEKQPPQTASEPVEQEIIDDTDDKKDQESALDVDLSLIPYQESQTDVSLNLSSPRIFADHDEQTKEVKLADASGYRAASLSFPWNRMTAVAAFRRDGYVWIVFDRKADFDFSVERELYKDIILEMVQIPHSHATIFRLVTQKGYNPSLRREGLLWVVDLMYQPVRPRQALDLILQRKTPFGPRIFVPLDESSQVIPLIDPEVGDLMYIVPIFALGKGVPNPRSFVDASFLKTAQGLVVVPNIEDLNVYSSTSGVEIRGPKGGMRFSSEDILSFLAKSKINANPLSQILDVAAWSSNEPKDYLKELKVLQNNVLKADKKNKDVQRLILARYYFANGMYPEAISVLRVIVADNPKMAELPGVIALRGAINFMMMRYDEAIKDLSSPLLKNDIASDYWRAATLAASSRTPEVYLPTMRENMAILQAYPYPIKTRLALAGLHAAVAGGDEFSVQNFMEAAFNSQNSDAENDEITFYHALWQESTGMYTMARREMKTLAQGDDFYFRAMGGLEKVRMDTRSKTITPQERIEELERLSYAWRGGEFEYNLMTMLVAAYQEQKNFSQVLHILKDMQVRFNGMPESKNIQKLMEDIFQKLYLGEDENTLSPVKAIALYEEFKDLTPSGEKGAQIVRRLADRLVSIDLLDRAADLLDDQLRQPIGNKERGLVSTRLALVRLLNKEPEKALKALKISEKSRFSEKIQKQRLYIEAKALADLKKTDEAAKLLENDDSQEAKMLRAEIYWQAQRWDKAADALKLLITRPQPDVPLSPQEAQRVLDWAAALRLAGRPKVVMRLRENFMPYMEKTKLAQAFDFITKTPQQGLLDYRQVAQEVESAESFHTFAKEYTNMIKTKGLSETVQ